VQIKGTDKKYKNKLYFNRLLNKSNSVSDKVEWNLIKHNKMDQQPPAQGQPQIGVAPNPLTEQNLNQLLSQIRNIPTFKGDSSTLGTFVRRVNCLLRLYPITNDRYIWSN